VEPHPVERVGQRIRGPGALVVGFLAEFLVWSLVWSLVVLVEGLVLVAVAWPHRRASVLMHSPGATAGRHATRVVP
jgi:hypothetical protein